jgi:hypothetical protein
MEDEKTDKEEVWSAIRYLDPDERERDKEVNTATIIATLALLLTVGGVWILLCLRVGQVMVPRRTVDEISTDQWRPDGTATSQQFHSFLIINTVLSSIWSSSPV